MVADTAVGAVVAGFDSRSSWILLERKLQHMIAVFASWRVCLLCLYHQSLVAKEDRLAVADLRDYLSLPLYLYDFVVS